MQILHRPFAGSRYPAGAEARCPELLAFFRGVFPGAEAGEVDFEYWVENTAILAALQAEADAHDIPLRLLPNHGPIRWSGYAGITPPAAPEAPASIMWGMFCQSDRMEFPVPANLLWNHRAATDSVDHWATTASFQAVAGRHIEILDMDADTLRAALARLREAGHTHAFLKTVHKAWTAILNLAEDIPEDIAWDMVHNEGAKNALILQGVIEPQSEYRLFVVGDHVVTGAGCIEDFTPLNHDPAQAFDVRVERVRNNGEIREDPELVSRYVAFAREFAATWARDVRADCAYTLDLCVDGKSGKIVPVELNALHNTGLYASNPGLLAKAMVEPLAASRAGEGALAV